LFFTNIIMPIIENYLIITLFNEEFYLLPQRAIFRPKYKSLILTDTHFGKSTHFQKSGIPVPKSILDSDLEILTQLINKWKPNEVLILGDMFHSHHNEEVEIFKDWLSCCVDFKTILIKGNHDILPTEKYTQLGLEIKSELETDNFIFIHDIKKAEKDKFYFKGHIHPGARVKLGRQRFTFPCFHKTKNSITLPAFGNFTGMSVINPLPEDQIFVIANEKIIAL